MLAIKRSACKAALADPETAEALEKASSVEECEQIIVAFCRKTDLKYVYLSKGGDLHEEKNC